MSRARVPAIAMASLLLALVAAAAPAAAEEASPEALLVPETLDRVFEDTD